MINGVSKDAKRASIHKAQAYLIRALPGGQLFVFLMTISIDDFQPEKVQMRDANMHTLTVVATFLAAVQAQLLGYSYQSNKTAIEVAINFFAFAGLALDVLGVAAGVTTHIPTQRVEYQTLRELQTRLREAQSLLEEKERGCRQISVGSSSGKPSAQDHPNSPSHDHCVSNVFPVGVAQDERPTVPVAPVMSLSQSDIQDQCEIARKQVRDARKRLFHHMLLALENDIHRIVCMELMKFGIQCFFLALILFAFHTQPRLVWIFVVVLTAVGILSAPLRKVLGLVEHAVLQRIDEQAADKVNWLDDVGGDSAFDAAEAREQRVSERMKQAKWKRKQENGFA